MSKLTGNYNSEETFDIELPTPIIFANIKSRWGNINSFNSGSNKNVTCDKGNEITKEAQAAITHESKDF